MNLFTENKPTLFATLTSISAGAAQWIDIIPGNIGKVTALFGLCVTIVVLVGQLRKNYLLKLEIQAKERELAIRTPEVKQYE